MKPNAKSSETGTSTEPKCSTQTIESLDKWKRDYRELRPEYFTQFTSRICEFTHTSVGVFTITLAWTFIGMRMGCLSIRGDVYKEDNYDDSHWMVEDALTTFKEWRTRHPEG